MNLEIFTPSDFPVDQGAVKQMKTCMEAGDAYAGVLCADHHLGYSCPIGGTIGYEGYVSPSSVGFDQACGNKAVSTDIFYDDISSDLEVIMDEISTRISFGIGRPNNEPVDHPALDRIRTSDNSNISALYDLAARQLGTVGAGNHYVDLFREEETDRVWIGVHFGSRGFGHKTTSGFLALAQGLPFNSHAPNESMYAEPTLFDVNSAIGQDYIDAMEIAGSYAYAGRDTVVNKVLEILGNPNVLHEVHNHHNYTWRETHGGTDLWVVRKGATPLWPGQQGFVGGSMGENAVIIEGKGLGYAARELDKGEKALWSAPHGAGRAMSRTEAKGKQRKRCQCHDCGHTQGHGEAAFQECPECHSPQTKRVWIQETQGKINWKRTKKGLTKQGIVLRGGDADEAPGAYKRLPAVLEAHKDYVEVIHNLVPIGVAMAGAWTSDPYKD